MRYYEYKQMRKQAEELGTSLRNKSGIRNRKPNLSLSTIRAAFPNAGFPKAVGGTLNFRGGVRKRPSTNQRMRNEMQDKVKKGSPFHNKLLRNSGF